MQLHWLCFFMLWPSLQWCKAFLYCWVIHNPEKKCWYEVFFFQKCKSWKKKSYTLCFWLSFNSLLDLWGGMGSIWRCPCKVSQTGFWTSQTFKPLINNKLLAPPGVICPKTLFPDVYYQGWTENIWLVGFNSQFTSLCLHPIWSLYRAKPTMISHFGSIHWWLWHQIRLSHM